MDRSPEAARESLYQTFLSQGDCETAAEVKVNQAFNKNPIKVLVEENMGWIWMKLLIHGMLLYLVSWLFSWFLATSTSYHAVPGALPYSCNSGRGCPHLALDWLYQCQAWKSTC